MGNDMRANDMIYGKGIRALRFPSVPVSLPREACRRFRWFATGQVFGEDPRPHRIPAVSVRGLLGKGCPGFCRPATILQRSETKRNHSFRTWHPSRLHSSARDGEGGAWALVADGGGGVPHRYAFRTLHGEEAVRVYGRMVRE
eukprot:gene12250-biopygen3456